MLQITFELSTIPSRKVAEAWCDAAVDCDLRSDQLGSLLMAASRRYPRNNPKRVLCYRIAAYCGHDTGSRLYRMIQTEKINEAKAEIRRIPDRKKFTWGSGPLMGTFVIRRGNKNSSYFNIVLILPNFQSLLPLDPLCFRRLLSRSPPRSQKPPPLQVDGQRTSLEDT